MAFPGAGSSINRVGAALVLAGVLGACGSQSEPRVTAYIAMDRAIAEPVLQDFERSSGIHVDAVFDTEANKTSGLVNRLVAEVGRPRADLFWDNETAQLTRLIDAGVIGTSALGTKGEGALGAGATPAWEDFAARARVFIVHGVAGEANARPDSIDALTQPQWKGRAALANPHFGTTGAHFAALLATWGEARFRGWLHALRENEIAILPGNAQVKDAVAAGRYDFGLTDTDDVNEALRDGKPVHLVIPDQHENEMGLFLMPNGLALIRGGPHPENARKLMNYLLSPQVETALARGDGAQIPIRNAVPGPRLLPPLSRLKLMKVDYAEVGRMYVRMLQIVDQEWPR